MHPSPRSRRGRSGRAALVAAAALALPAAAQADITLNVRDVAGAPVQGARVYRVAGQSNTSATSISAVSDAAGTLVLPTASLAGAGAPYRITVSAPYTACGQDEVLTGIADGANVTTVPYGLGALLCPDSTSAGNVSFALGRPTLVRGDAGATAGVKVQLPADASADAQLSVNGAPISPVAPYLYAGLKSFDITLPAADGPIVLSYLDATSVPHSLQVGNVSIGGATPASLNTSLARSFEFVIDNSGSMSTNDPTNQRFSAIQNLIQQGCIGKGDLVGAIGFDNAAYPIFTPVQPASAGPTLSSFQTALRNGIVENGGTDYNVAFGAAAGAFGSVAATPAVQPIVFFLTDGDHTAGTYTNAHRLFGAFGRAPVYSIGLGRTLSTTGRTLLEQIARETGGRYLNPQSSEDLVASLSSLCNAATGGTTIKYTTYTFANRNAKKTLVVKLRAKRATRFQVAWGNGGEARFRLAVTGPNKVVHTLRKPGRGWKAKITSSSAQLVAGKPTRGRYVVVATAVKVAGSTQRGTALVTVGGR